MGRFARRSKPDVRAIGSLGRIRFVATDGDDAAPEGMAQFSSILLTSALCLSTALVACTTETVRVVGGQPTNNADSTVEPEPPVDETPTEAPEPAADGGTSSSSGGGSSDGGSSSGGSSSGGSSSGGIAGFTGVGMTVAACQGKGTVSVPGVTMQSGFAARMAGQMNVFLYSRPTLSTMAYGGSAGEYKLRLLLGSPTGTPNQYQGQAGVSQWSAANGKWETSVGGVADIVLVDIVEYNVVDPTGLMCNGKVRGVAQWLSGSTPYVITFEVPILTTSFPGATAGPP